ncbi:hypothetical protein JHK86_016574 [Glycine max]|nr:hypothetical protein JHK86_016574 [Glycine max]
MKEQIKEKEAKVESQQNVEGCFQLLPGKHNQLSTFLSHRHSFVTPTYGGHHDSGHSFCGGAPLAYCDSGNTNVESAGYYVVPDVTTDVENTFSKSDVIPVFERHPSTSVVWLAPMRPTSRHCGVPPAPHSHQRPQGGLVPLDLAPMVSGPGRHRSKNLTEMPDLGEALNLEWLDLKESNTNLMGLG